MPNSNMQEFNNAVHFFHFQPEIVFLGKFGPKNQNYHFKLKFSGQPNSHMQNSVMLLTFFVFDQKYPFWENLVQQMKIVSLRYNLIPRLIQICRIKCRYSLFLFSIRNALFCANLVQIVNIVSLR